jgi:hypothetical protein
MSLNSESPKNGHDDIATGRKIITHDNDYSVILILPFYSPSRTNSKEFRRRVATNPKQTYEPNLLYQPVRIHALRVIRLVGRNV